MSPNPFDAGSEPSHAIRREAGSINLPFEAVPQPFTLDEQKLFSGGVVVAALYLDLGEVKHPAAMFRFAKPDGSGFYPPIVLACDRVEDLRALPALVAQAVEHALQVVGE